MELSAYMEIKIETNGSGSRCGMESIAPETCKYLKAMDPGYGWHCNLFSVRLGEGHPRFGVNRCRECKEKFGENGVDNEKIRKGET